MNETYLIAVDQGTSGTKTVLFDRRGRIASKGSCPLISSYPHPGYVEQDPEEIYQSVIDSVRQCLENFRSQTMKTPDIAACGISNQRETCLLWDKAGKPLCPAVVWQCKRSVDICARLKNTEIEEQVNQKTGLLIDPYFSGTKLLWLCEANPRIKDAVRSGSVYFGTIDTWLLFKLTGGLRYYTDYTNASRTLLFNIDTLQWDSHLLDCFSLQGLNLPQVRPSTHFFGTSDFQGLLSKPVKICSMIGDSHAAAVGEGCFSVGAAKATLGTGCSILLNTGSRRIPSKQGMVTTICWSKQDRVDYAMEGVIVTCGAAIQWLRDQLGLFLDSRDTAEMAQSIQNSSVVLIPAFSGLGTPHWRMDLKAAIAGLTFGCNKAHVVRAALESIPIQIKEVLDVMLADSGIPLAGLHVDGGITANTFVMQFLADLLNINVAYIGIEEVSALGAAYLAGLQAGVFNSLEELSKFYQNQTLFSPGPGCAQAKDAYGRYQKYLRMFLQTGSE